MAEVSVELGELADAIRRERAAGNVQVLVEAILDTPELNSEFLDAFAVRHGMKSIGEGWESVAADVALKHLSNLLHEDMAYGAEIMPRDRANRLAYEFLGLFGEGRFFTNADRAGASARDFGWDPLTDATFDSGIVGVGNNRVGMVWFEDED